MNISKINVQSYYANALNNKNNQDNISFGKKYYLDKYKAPRHHKLMEHREFLKTKVIKENPVNMYGWWTHFDSRNPNQCPWKIHLYSDNEKDWQKLAQTVEPYLTDNNASWKTLSHFQTADGLSEDKEQKGKSITIYPHSKEDFLKLAYELNYIVKKNKLQLSGTSIHGDRELGNSGRLFYRYELSSGRYKDIVFNLFDKEDRRLYDRTYRENVANSGYLADDMTIDDDPFYLYNPDTNSYYQMAYTPYGYYYGKN